MVKQSTTLLRCKLRRTLVPLLYAVVIILTSFAAGLLLLQHKTSLHAFGQWLAHYSDIFLLWRLCLLLIIFCLWPRIVRYRLRQRPITASTLRILINQRYLIVLFLLVYDVTTHILSNIN